MYLSDKYFPQKVTNDPTNFLFEGPFLKSNNFFFTKKLMIWIFWDGKS